MAFGFVKASPLIESLTIRTNETKHVAKIGETENVGLTLSYNGSHNFDVILTFNLKSRTSDIFKIHTESLIFKHEDILEQAEQNLEMEGQLLGDGSIEVFAKIIPKTKSGQSSDEDSEEYNIHKIGEIEVVVV